MRSEQEKADPGLRRFMFVEETRKTLNNRGPGRDIIRTRVIHTTQPSGYPSIRCNCSRTLLTPTLACRCSALNWQEQFAGRSYIIYYFRSPIYLQSFFLFAMFYALLRDEGEMQIVNIFIFLISVSFRIVKWLTCKVFKLIEKNTALKIIWILMLDVLFSDTIQTPY